MPPDAEGPALEVWGTFDVENLGDVLFPLILERELRARGHDTPLHLLSPYGGAMPFGEARVVGRLATIDDPAPTPARGRAGIVLGGGDILRFLPTDAARLVPGAAGQYRYDPFIGELAALAATVPVAWNGVGVPIPFESEGAEIVRRLAARSRYVSVRDEPSRSLLEAAGVERDIAVVPDPAFVVDRILSRRALDDAIERLRARGAYLASGEVLAFHVSFTSPAADREIARSLRRLLDTRPGLRLALVPIGPCHGDGLRLHSIANAIGPEARALPGNIAIVDLVAAIANADAFIGSSLHGNLLAARFGVPGAFLTLPSQRPHKLYACSEYLGRAPWNIDGVAELESVAVRLLDGDAPVDKVRMEQLEARVDRHYDDIAHAIFTGVPPEAPAELDDFPPRAACLVAFRSSRNAGNVRGPGGILALDRMSRATLHEQPYRWGIADDLFDPADRQALYDAYPVEPFATVDGYDGEKSYQYEARSLVAMGGRAPWRPDFLEEPWLRLATDLCSRAYRETLSAITGVPLDGLIMEANVFHYGPGSWLGPHIDLPEKVLTQILYFNPSWQPHDGGNLRVLGSGDEADVVAEIPPLAGSSAVLVRSDMSWHCVTKVAPTSSQSRRSVTVTFYPPDAISTMWPPGAEPALHRFPPS